MSTANTFTGRARVRRTRTSVRIIDRLARTLIAVGGIGTVVAVSAICVFLVWVVVPLFLPATIGEPQRLAVDWPVEDVIRVQPDDYQTLLWTMSRDGSLRTVHLDTGEVLSEQSLFADASPTAWAFDTGGREATYGFTDGSIRVARLDFQTSFPAAADLPAEAQQLAPGGSIRQASGLLVATEQGQVRLHSLSVSVSEPVMPAAGSAVALVDCMTTTGGRIFCTLSADDRLSLHSAARRAGVRPDETTSSTTTIELPYSPPDGRGKPAHLVLFGQGRNLCLVWSDGLLLRYDLRDSAHVAAVEQVDLVPEEGQAVTALETLPGKATLLVGDTLGRARAWFCARTTGAHTADGATMVMAHELSGPAASVTAIAAAPRSRLASVTYADGTLRVFYVTTARQLVESRLEEPGTLPALAVAPKADAIVALSPGGINRWPFNPRYPEVSLAALLAPVWYEKYDAPRQLWQSSGGSDDFEPKLGMLPLVFGTLKATVYSLLFAVPLALLSAIYTSEFMHPRARARIKPAIEMMASLPSVVLGFVAALVVAPFVEEVIPAVLAGIVVVPFTFLLAAHLWQLLPPRIGLALVRWRFAFLCAALPVGVLLSAAVGPAVERLLFGGDLRGWLDGDIGSGVGGWIVFLLPLAALGTALAFSRYVNPSLRRMLRGTGHGRLAAVDLAKFLVASALTMGVAIAAALLLESLHFDPRGAVLGTYVQRNALVVGFIMGFAIVPIIYTVADDALSTVPGHLRSASLGAGATPWQTAVRVIIPTATSGLFSAVMIGLGRAVGETMIVLMAAGNSPIVDWNVFNGFQTLSANIATELPEAVQGSAHYRTLFVAALALFAITFVVNTLAEAVRLRFRRRAYEL
ncbi:MAG: ABC transporter permease subunit [Planctomycetia bacterium]|nr:ABC transporter permease subunit [Planctomycetia bacterium]